MRLELWGSLERSVERERVPVPVPVRAVWVEGRLPVVRRQEQVGVREGPVDVRGVVAAREDALLVS